GGCGTGTVAAGARGAGATARALLLVVGDELRAARGRMPSVRGRRAARARELFPRFASGCRRDVRAPAPFPRIASGCERAAGGTATAADTGRANVGAVHTP